MLLDPVDEYKKKLDRELKSGVVSLLILDVIRRAPDPVYGYQLIKEIRELTDGRLELKEGSVYPILHYLQQKRFVVSFLGESSTGAPRKYYTVTKLGMKAHDLGMASWNDLKDIMAKVMIRKGEIHEYESVDR